MASHKVLPLGVLDKCVDKHVWILMKGQREFGGTLRGFDDFFNMVLQDATEVWVDNSTKESRKHETILLNGHDVAFIVPGLNPLQDSK